MSLGPVANGSAALLAISFDFANTLVPVRGSSFAASPRTGLGSRWIPDWWSRPT